MKKWILLIMLILLVQIVSAVMLDMCKDTVKIDTNCTMVTPGLNCANYTYDIVRTNGTLTTGNSTLSLLEGSLYYFNFTEGEGDYIVRLCDGTTREVVVGVEEDEMASLAVVVFILFITIAIFSLPKLVKRFSTNDILDTTLKGLCIVLGLYLLALDTVMVVTIADNFGLGINRELFRLLWLINWGAYFSMMLVVLSFFLKVLKLWRTNKEKKRMGYG